MVNITESKQAQEALNQERNFAAAIFETAGALVMVLDTEGRIVRFNRACEQTGGYSAGEVKDRFFWELFSIPQEVEKAKLFSRVCSPDNFLLMMKVIGWPKTEAAAHCLVEHCAPQ